MVIGQCINVIYVLYEKKRGGERREQRADISNTNSCTLPRCAFVGWAERLTLNAPK